MGQVYLSLNNLLQSSLQPLDYTLIPQQSISASPKALKPFCQPGSFLHLSVHSLFHHPLPLLSSAHRNPTEAQTLSKQYKLWGLTFQHLTDMMMTYLTVSPPLRAVTMVFISVEMIGWVLQHKDNRCSLQKTETIAESGYFKKRL